LSPKKSHPLRRAPAVPNSPGSFATFTRQISGVTVVDAATLLIETKGTYPLLPNDLAQIPVISLARAEGRSTQDFNAGAAAIGTGPYKFVRWVPGDRLELARNDDYWGGRQPWEKVVVRFIPNAAARVAALLAGDVDMIDAVPTTDVARLRDNKAITIASATSNRAIFLNLDGSREVSPFVQDNQGQPLKPNPLRDVRVRQAISLAIDRELITKHVMEGQAIPAAQLVPRDFFGASARLAIVAADTVVAKRLMEAAGHKDGFLLTLHTPNDRYVNDAKIAQAIAQMLARIGIRINVEAMPYSVFATRSSARNPEFKPDAQWLGIGQRGVLGRPDSRSADLRSHGWNRLEQSWPLLQRSVRHADRESKIHHRRCGSPEAARRCDGYRHERCGRYPLALPSQHLGDPRQGPLRSAHRREHIGYERLAGQVRFKRRPPLDNSSGLSDAHEERADGRQRVASNPAGRRCASALGRTHGAHRHDAGIRWGATVIAWSCFEK
jgi:ABC-type transport system substrate-binding protein